MLAVCVFVSSSRGLALAESASLLALVLAKGAKIRRSVTPGSIDASALHAARISAELLHKRAREDAADTVTRQPTGINTTNTIATIHNHLGPLQGMTPIHDKATKAPGNRSAPMIQYSVSSETEPETSSNYTPAIFRALDPARRSARPGYQPNLRLRLSSDTEYVFAVRLPGYQPEMITIITLKDERLSIVADNWMKEENSKSSESIMALGSLNSSRVGHHEWIIKFAVNDVDLRKTRAAFNAEGLFTLRIPKKRHYDYSRRPL